ncbi:hypothetical protein [Chenggangzhangella methanolivorans]|uniref:Uncharacterized protein n=1 Tax=Chenggangzhangella methanolivorans TaxID=1437009 RepID=A0A9E6UKD7_9HYPH|nr:hypothetical protein [Chenggangzhangella methanolivorans]QZN99176.1 hypothetical protein K6K41_20420 [Chenggangzhangella methanolivorans]
MASKSPVAYRGREQSAFPADAAVAHNDAEPFPTREVHVELSLRARVAPRTAEPVKKRAAAAS